MRCTDCKFSKELIPAELHYVYCNQYRINVSVVNEFEVCWYRTTEEYKIKQLITNFCNADINHIVCVDYDSLCCYVANQLEIPNAIKNYMLYKDFRAKVGDILKKTLKNHPVAKLQNYETGECDVLILKGECE